MRATFWRALCIVGCSLLGPLACNLTQSPADDGGRARDSGSDPDEGGRPDAAEAGADADDGPAAGPLTNVVEGILLSDQRMCDLDASGTADNSFADLGARGFAVVSALLAAAIDGPIDVDGQRFLVHFPWIDDLATPEDVTAPFILFEGVDTDDPRDSSDDFSGTEPYYASHVSLDSCGEPTYWFVEGHIADGTLTATSRGVLVLGNDYPIAVRGSQARGHLEPRGAAMSVSVCGYVLVRDLGALAGIEDLHCTILEMLLFPERCATVPVSGITPDIDLDGDGLERFADDGDGRIAACLDGDGQTIPGADCWQDDRIADAFSITLELQTVGAAFAGLEPGWQDEIEGPECTDPPEQSAWSAR